jgi:exodeoxyribonuclease III
MKRLITYNVNGIRSALNKGFAEFLEESKPDIVCLQELKAVDNQIDKSIFEDLGYQIYLHPAQKKGYSGVGILSKEKPNHIEIGMGLEKYDREGRVIRADYDHYSLISVYMPSGSSGEERQAFKMDWLDDFHGYIQDLKKIKPNLVISGDYNICHQAMDIHNPISNKNSSGFLPEEREWMSKFIENGFTDSFRYINPSLQEYSWWSFRFQARSKNLGWRIDYHMVSDSLKKNIANAEMWQQIVHSDHCPVVLDLKFDN